MTDGRRSMRRVRWAPLLLLLWTGVGCEEETPTLAVPEDRWLAWSAPLAEPADGVPVAFGDLVVVAGASGVTAYAQADGAVRWRAEARGAGSSRRLLERGGTVYAAGHGAVRALEGSTGRLLWTRELGEDASPDFADAEIDERALYVGTRDQRVLALDPASGATLWERRVEDVGGSRSAVRGVTRSGDTLYVAVTRALTENLFEVAAVVVALDRRDGRELWRYQSADRRTAAGGAPVLAGPLLVTGGGAEGTTIAVDRFTGREAWSRQLYGYVWGMPLLADGVLYVTTQAARAYALDPATGTVRWESTLGAGSRYAAPCAGRLVVPNYHVDVLDPASGRHLGLALRSSDTVFASAGLAVAGDRAFVPAYSRLLAVECRG